MTGVQTCALPISGRLKRKDPAVPLVALATAHPAKFPEAVKRATGIEPALPPALADLRRRPEHCATLPNDAARLFDYLRRHAGKPRAAKAASAPGGGMSVRS